MRAQEGHSHARYRAAAAIAGVAAAGSLAVTAMPAHAAPAAWKATAVINVGAGAGVMAEDMRTGTVWVTNYQSDTVSVIDERTRKVTAVIPVGADPDAIAADPRTGLVFVVDGGADYGQAGDVGTVTALSDRTRKALGTVTVGPSPDGIAVDGGSVFVSDGNFGAPGGFESPADGFVSVVSERTGLVTSTFDGGPGPGPIAAAGGRLWVADEGSVEGGSVSELSEKTGAVLGGFSPGFATGALVADPADRTVYAGSVDDNAGGGAVITGVGEATGKVTGTIPILDGSDPWPIAVDPGAGRLFALGGGGQLSVVGLKAGAVTATVPAGNGADGIAVDPCSGDVYVADGIKGTVTVYRQG